MDPEQLVYTAEGLSSSVTYTIQLMNSSQWYNVHVAKNQEELLSMFDNRHEIVTAMLKAGFNAFDGVKRDLRVICAVTQTVTVVHPSIPANFSIVEHLHTITAPPGERK